MEPGTFCFHYAVETGTDTHKVNVSVDVLIQPKALRRNKLPIMVEAKSAGDFTNTNKRRKEEAKKISQLKATSGMMSVTLCFCADTSTAGISATKPLTALIGSGNIGLKTSNNWDYKA